MDWQTLEQRYMAVPAMYSKRTGIWPIPTNSRRPLAIIVIYTATVLTIITEVGRIVKFYSLNTLLDELPFVCVPVGIIVKHMGHLMNHAKFRKLFEHILDDWRQTNTAKERKILEEYAKRGVFYNFIYAVNLYFVSIVFFLVPILPYVLDIVMPLNETRPKMYMYDAYYFVQNQDDYFYYIVMFNMLFTCISMNVFIATDTILITTVQHCCGLLALAGHRIEFSLHNWSSSSNHTEVDYRNMYKSVNCSIATHQRALTYLIEIENAYKVPLFLLMGVSVVAFTATLCRAGTVPLSAGTYQYYGYVAAQFVHMFFLTVQGQFVINVHDIVYRQGLDALWYNADNRTKSLFILIIRQCLTPPKLTAGGLMQLNFDTFAEIVKASVSYFTVLKSM